MIEPSDLLIYVIKPVLKDLGLWSVDAEKLILGTACAESGCGRFLHQIGGPALGIYQMEPDTHNDIWDNFIEYRPELVKKLELMDASGHGSYEDQLPGNLYYATAMCRIHYLRVPAPIPDSLPKQAAYWKNHYNTELGKGSTDDYMAAWYRYVGHGTWV
jgi:hypothetical protein